MTDALPFVAILVACFAVGFPLIWWAVVNLIARLGWALLAEEFASQGKLDPLQRGDHFTWRSGVVGWLGSYRNVLEVWVTPDGLWLRPLAMFRAGHAMLMIPWTAVTRIRTRDALLSVECSIEVRLASGRLARVTLFGKDIAESIARSAPAAVARG